jgi:hypothetical protein
MYKSSLPQRGARSATSRILLTCALFSGSALCVIATVSGAWAQEPKKATSTTASTTASTGVKTTVDPGGPSGEETANEAAGPSEQEQADAKLAFEAGTKAFGEENYEAALSEFKAALDKVPSAHAQYWVARAMDAVDTKSENTAAVVSAYSTFLSNPAAAHVEAEHVAQAQARVVELKKLLPALIKLATVPAGATVIIDGKKHSSTTPLEVELAAGAHRFEISLEGYEPTMVEMDLQGGSTVEQEVSLSEAEPSPVVATPATQPPVKRSLVPAAVTLGLGGAGLISGTLFGIMALGAKKDFNDNPTTANADTAERNALIADMSFGIALTLGITGIVLLTAQDEEAAAEVAQKRRMLVAPYADKKGGGIAGLLRF